MDHRRNDVTLYRKTELSASVKMVPKEFGQLATFVGFKRSGRLGCATRGALTDRENYKHGWECVPGFVSVRPANLFLQSLSDADFECLFALLEREELSPRKDLEIWG